MTEASRADSRSGYRHFPQAYMDILLRARNHNLQRIGPFTIKEAHASRRSLYSFFGQLRAQYDEDDFARSMSDIARELILSIEQDQTDKQYYIIAKESPLVRALRGM